MGNALSGGTPQPALAVEVEGLVKNFGDFAAVNGVNLGIPRGHILALLGPNGAGKTTMVRVMAAALPPSAGRVRVLGHDSLHDAQQVRCLVGLLTETPGLYERMLCWDYLDFFGRLRRLSRADRHQRLESLLKTFEIWDHRDDCLGTFSKGMRQKAGLIRTLLHDPPVLFLDEPTSALDPRSAKIVRDYISGLRARGRTVVWCTHNLAEAEAVAETIAIISQGRLIALGSPEKLQRELAGQPRFQLQVAGEARAYLSCLDGLVQVEAVRGGLLLFSSPDPELTNPSLVRRLVAAGAEVVSLTEQRSNLEEVYLRIVEGAA